MAEPAGFGRTGIFRHRSSVRRALLRSHDELSIDAGNHPFAWEARWSPKRSAGRGGRHVAEDAFHDRRIGRAPGQRRIADQRVAFAGVRRFVVTVLHDVSFAGGGLREGHDTAQRQDIPRERLGDVRQIVFIIGVEIGAAEVHEQGLTCSLRTLLQIDGPVRRAVVERDGQLSQSVQVAPRVGLGGFDPQFVHAGFARRDRHAAVVPVPDETDAPTGGRPRCAARPVPFRFRPDYRRRSAPCRA